MSDEKRADMPGEMTISAYWDHYVGENPTVVSDDPTAKLQFYAGAASMMRILPMALIDSQGDKAKLDKHFDGWQREIQALAIDSLSWATGKLRE